MCTFDSVQELTDCVYLLDEDLKTGKIKIAQHLKADLNSSLQRIKLDNDGLVIPETVDRRVRTLIGSLRYFRDREHAKQSTSSIDIQKTYFDFLEINFGHIHAEMIRTNTNPNIAGHIMSRDSEFVDDFSKNIDGFMSHIEAFWHSVGNTAIFHLEDSSAMKAVFGGDLFPSYTKNIASNVGIYVDTIVLPCPFMRMANLVKRWQPQIATYYIVKHALNALSYKMLALADVDPPIVVVLPDLDVIDPTISKQVQEFSKAAAIRHGSTLFGEPFSSIDELQAYLEPLARPDELLTKLKRPDRLLFNKEWQADAQIQLNSTLSDIALQHNPLFANKHAGHAVLMQCIGRMAQAGAMELRSVHLSGTPLVDAETSWDYLNWKMEYDADPSHEDSCHSQSMHIVRALGSEQDKNLCWLGNIPPEALIEIRKLSLTDEVRDILSKGVPKLVKSNPLNFFRTSDQVVENINIAFQEHQKVLLDARKHKIRFLGLDVGACLMFGGISVAAAITSSPTLGTIAGALGLVGIPNIREIKSKFIDLRTAEQRRRKTPTGILFRHLK